MILQLSHKHSKSISAFFLFFFSLTVFLPGIARASSGRLAPKYSKRYGKSESNFWDKIKSTSKKGSTVQKTIANEKHEDLAKPHPLIVSKHQGNIGGPSQPEMSSFKSVGTDNMVNLFTGDFNYNIPLLDVGGYPINIYYSGGVSPEQEASWVGLGWNINPGNINRNVRGVPDDFNGQDTLQQIQKMKPNKTWGLGIGADLELLGIKAPIKAELGVAFNNYLGPSLDLALRGNSPYKILSIAGSEKISAGAGLNIGIDINSRSGSSFSGSLSLTGNALMTGNKATFGGSLSTGYNSRSGIKALQLSEQHSLSYDGEKAALHKRSEDNPYRGGASINTGLYSTSISFAKPSYTPIMRMPLTNTAWSGHFQVGLGSFGVAADVEAEVYGQKSEVYGADTLQMKPMIGYLYSQNAASNPAAVMDIARFNDREVTPNTPIISVPQYSYDVFTIQGEGTGGSIRAFRNDLGYMRDNFTASSDKNLSIGGDIDPPGHYGGNFNTIKTPSTIGEWNSGNKLRSAMPFTRASTTFENVYFRNPGENCVVDSNRLKQVGGIDLVRFVLGGSGNAPTIEPKLQSFTNTNSPNLIPVNLLQRPVITERNKRSQVINFLTAFEASVAGLDKVIKSYDNNGFLDPVTDTLLYETISRVDGLIRKPHHISQINVTENNGKRYVYGVPVYNLKQQDFTFSVDNLYSQIPEKIKINASTQASSASPLLNDTSSKDGYVQVTTTPAYAHSFLLSGILSPDYVDVTGNGITEDDIGTAVKFNYTRIKSGTSTAHKWRAPFSMGDTANFNPGLRSEIKDDKGMISYGERESWYLQSVESKTMVALFYVSPRSDGRDAKNYFGQVDTTKNFTRELDSIALYNKSDLKANGLSKARPIKTVHFKYSYTLCQNTPDNSSGIAGSKGKLTLDSLWFTYNGKARAFNNKYGFTYVSTPGDNPGYNSSSSDRWGTYKPPSMNPSGMTNSDYPYAIQDSTQKAIIDQNASAWMLRKILLPSGGQIEVNYESDDYAYVQNRRATNMMRVAGFGSGTSFSAASDRLYPTPYIGTVENDYVFIQVPVACANATEVYNRYLQGLSQLAFKIWVLMPKGPEYITCYATINGNNYGVDGANPNIIWVKLNRLGGKSPLSLTALEFLRQQLPGQAFTGYDVSGEPGFQQVGDLLVGWLKSLRDAFTDPVNAFRKDNKACRTDLSKCFVRLNDPDGVKYGGGHRVKTVVLKDNWNAMTGQYTSTYGQKYDYTTTESFNGNIRTISSGVASYEPSIGGEENPFQTVLQVEDYLPAGPTSFGAVEMPVLDAFFPSPVVGYSKVTVSSIKTDTATTKKSRSGIGKQISEFFTAKDYPVYYNYTPFDDASVKEFHQASTLAFFNKYAYDFKAQSQGFLIATNDMHGKMKSQSSYAESDTGTRISYTENFYRNTGTNGLNDKFNFIKDSAGTVYTGNMGIDVDLMTDTREFAVKSSSMEVQGQVDIFYFVFPIPIPTIWSVSGTAQNIYRSVTTTKVVNYHSVLDSIVVIDKGSQVSTKNLAYDAETGEVLISRTNNEFNQPIYSTSYPAYWAYGGMGLAYKNIDAVYTGVNFSDGKITSAGDFSAIESGDELLVTNTPASGVICDPDLSAVNAKLIWAYDKNKNTTSLTTTPDMVFLDKAGNLCNMSAVNFRVIRSGHRNLLDAKAAVVTGMADPIASGKLSFNAASKVVNASATEFREKWQTDNDVFGRFKSIKNPNGCGYIEVPDSVGYLEKRTNPYCKGLLGNFRPYRNMVFYDGRQEFDTTVNTNVAANGLLKNFKLYWDFTASKNLIPDTMSTQWVWNSRLNKTNAKGMELETQDALGIFTAAQYGYKKTMPVAIANNSRYSEMFAESFEDYGYDESTNNTSYNFYNRHIDFSKSPNSFLLNTDGANFKAHSGRYVLGVNGAATSSMDIPVSSQADGSSIPAMNFTKDTTRVLNTLGGSYSFNSTVPKVVSSDNQGTATFSTSNPGLQLDIYPIDSFYTNGTRMHYYTQSGNFYINIATANTYSFNMSMSTAYNNSGATVYNHSNGFAISIYDTLGNSVSSYTLGQDAFNYTSVSYTAYLCPGIYRVDYSTTEMYNATNNGATGTHNFYNWSCTNSTSPDYKNLAKVNGCVFSRPIPATVTMQNPVFTVPGYKKMLFSAWVRENCGDAANGIPCKDNTYTHNQVQLKFNVSGLKDSVFSPTGPIIDGWQRYEGTFTVPSGINTITLSLVNSGTTPVYFDDIRIHPFNANIKSYVYDPVNLRLTAELDANNYANLHEYDEEGVLVRTKAETREGVKTISETRTALQKKIQ